MNKKLPFIFLAPGFFILIYALLWSPLFFYFTHERNYSSRSQERAQNVFNYIKLGYTLFKHEDREDIEQLSRSLNEALAAHQIDFFIVKNHETLISSGSRNKNVHPEAFPYEINKLTYRNDFAFSATSRRGYFIGIGIDKSKNLYLEWLFLYEKQSLITELVAFVVLCITIIGYFFKDIRQIINALSSHGYKHFGDIKTKSKDSEIILRGLKRYADSVNTLAGQNSILSTEVLSALKTELDSGLTPPYMFEASLVRTDINSFSSICSTNPVEPFMNIVNEFFSETCQIISRYGGLVSRFIGDEVIFYFRNNDYRGMEAGAVPNWTTQGKDNPEARALSADLANGPSNATGIALSAIRDINKLSERFNTKTQVEHGYPFVVKSALSAGRFRFGRLVNGHDISGCALVESVRILSHINERTVPVVLFNSLLEPNLPLVFITQKHDKAELKGLIGLTELSAYLGHQPVESLLANLNPGTASLLTYYRNDDDIAAILNNLTTTWKSLPLNVLNIIFKTFRSYGLPTVTPIVKTAYVKLLADILAEVNERNTEERFRIISSAVSICTNLIPKRDFDREFHDVIALAIAEDARSAANAIDVLGYYETIDATQAFLIKHKDNRVRANILIYLSIKHFTRKTYRPLERMLHSSNPKEIASAAYAVGEIMKTYNDRDPIFVSTNSTFAKFSKTLHSLVTHPDPSVRNQANLALNKCPRL